MRLANKEEISVLGRKLISQGRETQPTGRFGFVLGRKPISQGRETQPTGRFGFGGLKEHLVIPSQNCPPPLS